MKLEAAAFGVCLLVGLVHGVLPFGPPPRSGPRAGVRGPIPGLWRL